MRKLAKIVMGSIFALALCFTSLTVSAAPSSVADITAQVTGKSAEEIANLWQSGKSYGQIASEAGKLEEFKSAMLDNQKQILDAEVANGKLTQEQADSLYSSMQTHQGICDGTAHGNCYLDGSGCNINGHGHGNNGYCHDGYYNSGTTSNNSSNNYSNWTGGHRGGGHHGGRHH